MATLTRVGHVLRTVAQGPIIATVGVVSLFQPVLESVGLLSSPAAPEGDLRGKTVLVTGGTSGVGLATACRLCRMGATVVVTGRDPERLARAVAAVLERAGASGGSARGEALDLCSLASVRDCARRLAREGRAVDVVVLNAGTNANVPTALHADLRDTSLVFGVNFVAQWLLFTLLRPVLPEGARLVCLSSVAHHQAVPQTFGTAKADYAESKLAMNLLARAASRGDLLGPKVVAVAVNPGAVDSDIWRHVWFPLDRVFAAVSRLAFLTNDEGAATSVVAAASPRVPLGPDGLPAYLAPFWSPARGPARSAFEYLGVFVGAAPAFERLPDDEARVASDLFATCAALAGDFAAPLA